MKYKAIIFDFFDVVYADAFKRWRQSKGLKLEGALGQASVDMDIGLIDRAEFLRRLADIAGVSVEQLQAELEKLHILNDEILPLIEKLGDNYRLGLLSNASSEFLRGLLRKHNLDPLFHHIVISSEVDMVKPSPEIFEHILAKLKVPAGQAIFIDDKEENVYAAEKLGLTGIVYIDVPNLRHDLGALGIIT